MKIVYIILAHTNHEQTLRLFNRLNKDGVNFVFHISKTSDSRYFEKVFSALKDQPNCYFAERAVVRWGDFGVVQGALNAIDTIHQKQINYDYAILLSGQCYPIKSHEVICQTLEKYKGKQILENIPFSEKQDDYFHRILLRHFWIGSLYFRYPRQAGRNKLLAALLNLLLFPFTPKRQPLTDGYLFFKGSLWWTLTGDCVEYIRRHAHSEDGQNLINFLKKTYHSGETYFQTVLMNSEYKESIVNKDLRYILWQETKGNTGHPNILTTDNFDDIASSECLFGRKFDIQIDAKILDMIDEFLL
jgi:hypothetical protein